MGKKTKKKRSPKPVPLPDDNPTVWKNPDGSDTMVQKGEIGHIGGRTLHLGQAGMPVNAGPYTYDPVGRARFQQTGMGERQLNNVQAMSDAFHRQDNLEVDPMTEAALSLETKVGLKYAGVSGKLKIDAKAINESMIMSTHRWIVTVLPSAVIREVSKVVLQYREALRSYKPIIKVGLPDPQRTFDRMHHVTDKNRPDVISLMNSLFEYPYGINAFVYSESDGEIHLVIKEFIRSSEGLCQLPPDASSSDILEYIHGRAGFMDNACCFWCEKNKLATEKLFVCTQCMAVSYCSKDCQTRDWKAFHKKECAKLCGKDGTKMTRDELGLVNTRSASLRKDGVAPPRVPIKIADSDNEEHIFRGDVLACYITNMNMETMAVDDKTKFFPYGLHIIPREVASVAGM